MTSHDEGLRTLKPSSSPEEPDSRILMGYCGDQELRNPSTLHTGPKAHAKEEEMPKDEQRESRLPGYITEDDPVLGRLKSRKGKTPRRQRQSPRASQRKFRAQWASHRGMVEEQF